MARSKQRTFHVYGRVVIDVGIAVQADSLSAAMERAGNMKFDEFVEAKGDVNDVSHSVTGVFRDDDSCSDHT